MANDRQDFEDTAPKANPYAGSSTDQSMARVIRQLENLISKIGGGSMIATAAEAPRSVDKYESVLKASDASMATMDISMRSLNSAINKLTTATERSSVVRSQSARSTSIADIVPRGFGASVERRKDFIATIDAIENPRRKNTISSRLDALSPSVTNSFSEVLDDEQFIDNLKGISKYGKILKGKDREALEKVAATGSDRKIAQWFEDIGQGNKSLRAFNESLDKAGLAAITLGGQLAANYFNFQASIKSNPYATLADEASRRAKYEISNAGTIGGVGLASLATVGAGLAATGVGAPLGLALMAGAGVVGYTTGHAMGTDYETSHLLGSDSYNTNMSYLLGGDVTPQQLREIKSSQGLNFQMVASLSSQYSGQLGSTGASADVIASVGANRFAMGAGFNMRNATIPQLVAQVVKLNELSKISGSSMSSFERVASGNNYQMSQVTDAAMKLAGTTGVVSGAVSLPEMTERYMRIQQRNPLMAKAFLQYQNAGFTQKTTTDALNEALFGSDTQDILTGKTSKRQMLTSLKRQGISASLLKDISQPLYQELEGSGKSSGSVEENTATLVTQVTGIAKILKEHAKASANNAQKASMKGVMLGQKETPAQAAMRAQTSFGL